jgi:hypothetical protein
MRETCRMAVAVVQFTFSHEDHDADADIQPNDTVRKVKNALAAADHHFRWPPALQWQDPRVGHDVLRRVKMSFAFSLWLCWRLAKTSSM